MLTKIEAQRLAKIYSRTHDCVYRDLQDCGGHVVTFYYRDVVTHGWGVDCTSAAMLSDVVESGLVITK